MFSEMTIQPIQYHWLIAMTVTGLSTEVLLGDCHHSTRIAFVEFVTVS